MNFSDDMTSIELRHAYYAAIEGKTEDERKKIYELYLPFMLKACDRDAEEILMKFRQGYLCFEK